MGNPVVHFEILSRDYEKLFDFYGSVFDWKIDANNPMNYGVVDAGEAPAGGIGGVMDENQPNTVTFYVQADDLEATLKAIEAKGGKTVMEPSEVPGGPTIATFTDPAGNLIGLVKAQ